MFKFLLLLFLIIYIIAKLGGFLLRTFFSGFSSQARHQNYHSAQGQRTQQRPKDGNVIIAFDPKEKGNTKDGGNFKGGDYVNYEEIE